MCIWLCSVFLELRVINNDNLVCTILCQLIYKSLYTRTDQNSCNFCIQRSCELLCFSKQLKCDAAQLIVYLLCKDIDTLIFF